MLAHRTRPAASLRSVAASVVALALGCAAARPPARPLEAAPGRILDTRAGRTIAEDDLLARLAGARFVILGERHDHPEHHALQARVVRGLAARGGRPALAFEMLSIGATEALAAALANPGASADDVRRAVRWDASGWPDFALYAPVFEAGLAAGLPLVAADLPRDALAALRRGGIAALEPALRAVLRLDEPVPPAVRNALADDIRASHCGLAPESALPRMVDAQVARDAHLARSLDAAAQAAGAAILIAGAGHARTDVGVPLWLARRAPGAPVASVGFVELGAPGPPGDDAARFDFVWYTDPLESGDPCEEHREQLEKLHHRR
jgi:uncharacterized iron-regulated protein